MSERPRDDVERDDPLRSVAPRAEDIAYQQAFEDGMEACRQTHDTHESRTIPQNCPHCAGPIEIHVEGRVIYVTDRHVGSAPTGQQETYP